MPFLLKFLTVHSLFCSVFLLVSVIPLESYVVNELEVGFDTWWTSGAAYGAVTIGTTLPISGWLMLKRHRYCRAIYLVSFFYRFHCQI